MRLCVLVIDDHELVRVGVRSLLARQPWVDRCVPARGGDDAAQLAHRFEPHVTLVDVDLGGELGVGVARRVREAWPPTRIVLLAPEGVVPPATAAAAGAVSVVGKEADGATLADVVRRAALGYAPARRRACAPRTGACALSVREREVLGLIARGSTNREIASALQLSPHTVKQHASTAFRKLQARNRVEAIRHGQRLGLIA